MATRWTDFDRTFSAMDDFRRRMDRLFDDLELGRAREGEQLGWPGRGAWPRVDLVDAGASLLLQAELPGMVEKDVNISLHHDVLTLSGERRPAPPEGYSVQRQERPSVRFSRSVPLPCKVDPEKTTATLQNGILTVALAKVPEAQPRQIMIKAQ